MKPAENVWVRRAAIVVLFVPFYLLGMALGLIMATKKAWPDVKYDVIEEHHTFIIAAIVGFHRDRKTAMRNIYAKMRRAANGPR